MIKRSQDWQDLGLNLALLRDSSSKITTKEIDIRMSDFFFNCMKVGSSQILESIRPKQEKKTTKDMPLL